MLKQLFATMHDVLDEVITKYPTADGKGKQELNKKLDVLKKMSDTFIEEWLQFEEKLAQFLESIPGGALMQQTAAALPGLAELPEHVADAFRKGQGYFQLLMYDNAIQEFDKVIQHQPDFMMARLYLAMGHLRNENDSEAYRHFRFITSLTDHAQMKAISLNAMGCIQAKNNNLEQAQELFQLAYETDPSCVEPMINMGICMSQSGEAGHYGQSFMH